MDYDLKWYFICMMVVVLAGVLYFGVREYNNGQIAQQCVAAGSEWKQVKGDYYECVK